MIRKLRMRDYAPDAFENPDLQCHYGLVESLALQRDEVERPEDTTMPDEDKMRERLKVKKIRFFAVTAVWLLMCGGVLRFKIVDVRKWRLYFSPSSNNLSSFFDFFL